MEQATADQHILSQYEVAIVSAGQQLVEQDACGILLFFDLRWVYGWNDRFDVKCSGCYP
jgi:hypothetical protein